MAIVQTSLRIHQPTEADWKAAERDMIAIFEKYGETVQGRLIRVVNAEGFEG